MLLYVLVYVLGIVTGAGLLIVNRRSIQKAVNAEKAVSDQIIQNLKRQSDAAYQERNALLRERELNQAYCEGRKSPYSDVEKFAAKLEERKVTFVDTSSSRRRLARNSE